MKIAENKYRCGFCGDVVSRRVNKVKGSGKKGTATDQIKCLRCGNYISQKTKQELVQ